VKSQRLNKKKSAKAKNGKSEQLFNNFSSWPLKMPTYRTEEEGEIDLLRANGGLAQSSLYKRKNTEDNFRLRLRMTQMTMMTRESHSMTQNESMDQLMSRRAQVGRLQMTRMTMKTQIDPGLDDSMGVQDE
jgi:hypothetical protein